MKTKKQYICPELLVVNVKAQLLTNVSIQGVAEPKRVTWDDDEENEVDAGNGW